MNKVIYKQSNLYPVTTKPSADARNTSHPIQSAMDPSSLNYNHMSSLSQTLLDAPTFNDFDAAFGFASNSSYPEPRSGPESPSYPHSHDENTGDESGDYLDSQTASAAKPRMETRRRKPGHRKIAQPQDQILKRRVQNRAAQRSFRERQKEYVHDLEHQVEQLKGDISRLHDNYQELLKAVTSGLRVPQWSSEDMSPVSLDEFDYNGSVESMSPVKLEANVWPSRSNRDYQGLLYA